MKEAIVFKGSRVVIQDVEVPELPTENHLLIQVVVSGMNPKDWAIAERVPGLNQGDDIAGIVHSVGKNVKHFRPGDRVAGFHEMLTAGGSFAEYAIVPESTTVHLPGSISFEEGATIPLTCATAALGLYQRLGLPLPWQPAQARTPLVIYGAASAVGAFAIKLARLSNIHPLICVAGRGMPYVESLIDPTQGDIVIDYRKGNDAVVASLKKALLPNEELEYAFDAVTDKGSYQNIMRVMHKKGKITFVLARKTYEGVPDSISKSFTQVGRVHADHYPGLKDEKKLRGAMGDREFGVIIFKFIELGLAQGWLRGHPSYIIPGGLLGLQQGLTDLKNGHASAVKYVIRIAETDDLHAKL